MELRHLMHALYLTRKRDLLVLTPKVGAVVVLVLSGPVVAVIPPKRFVAGAPPAIHQHIKSKKEAFRKFFLTFKNELSFFKDISKQKGRISPHSISLKYKAYNHFKMKI